ncbi:hypothetical protein AJ78_02449 [Emergomyces pasteurianus Ep9510]|uniref:Uncharacterized protein n=1 Tax=Emergomyces pasteurianus Ep9510 TaxID=1447872 RepID=A0A1J9QNN3_9EURO|nr:hypothetical protein AJ78_02449 [Emergomyces pasteurianus Ep9510]
METSSSILRISATPESWDYPGQRFSDYVGELRSRAHLPLPRRYVRLNFMVLLPRNVWNDLIFSSYQRLETFNVAKDAPKKLTGSIATMKFRPLPQSTRYIGEPDLCSAVYILNNATFRRGVASDLHNVEQAVGNQQPPPLW